MRKFDEELSDLNEMLTDMGMLIEEAISRSIKALQTQDVELARQAIEFDEIVDNKEHDIENLCLKLLVRHHPVAGDLRLVSSALKMITDMERIGDHAADIAEILVMLTGMPYINKLERITQMADATVKMLTESIDAFVKKDLSLARAVIEYDNVVDELFISARAEIIDLILHDQNIAGQAMDLLMVAKYFERIGDHAENIAEWVVFSITGKHVKDKHLKDGMII